MSGSTWGRIVGVGLLLVVVLLAASLPKPAAEAGPEFAERIEPVVEASALPSLWHCPWINSGSTRSSFLALAAVPDVEADSTHPDPRVGEPADLGSLSIAGPGAIAVDVAEIVNRGDAPGFIEFSDGPATATAIVAGLTALSGDRCVGSIPKLWHIAGLTTRDGYDLVLRLFNPIPDNAKVAVQASSELGSEALPDLQSVDIVGRTWVDIDLAEEIPFLDNLAITVSADEGTVIPVVIQGRELDEASWPGTGLSTVWEFPTATLAGLTPRLAVWNPNTFPVTVDVDLYTQNSNLQSAFTETIEAGRPAEFPLADQASRAAGIRVRATAAVAATVIAEDVPEITAGLDESDPVEAGSRIAATIGAPKASRSWLLPGAGADVGGRSSIWLLNTSSEAVTITIQPLGSGRLVADKVRLDAKTFRRVRLPVAEEVGGYRVDAATPISVSWSLQTDQAVALFAGVAIGG